MRINTCRIIVIGLSLIFLAIALRAQQGQSPNELPAPESETFKEADGVAIPWWRTRFGFAASTGQKPAIVRKFPFGRTGDGFDIGSSIALLPNKTIWASGGWKAKMNVLYSTSDFGEQWVSRELPVEALSVTAVLSFSDSRNGWAVGSRSMVKTDDGGESWQIKKLPFESKIVDLQSVRFFDSNVGFAGGGMARADKRNSETVAGIEILCTDNGGAVWRVCYRNARRTSIYSIVTSPTKTVYGISDGVLFLVSEDQGKKWTEVELTTPVTSVAVDRRGAVWLFGPAGFRFSKDKGRSWQAANPPDDRRHLWTSLDFSSNGAGIAVGENGEIAITRNDGATWEMIPNASDERLLEVKIQDSLGVILGEKNIFLVNLN